MDENDLVKKYVDYKVKGLRLKGTRNKIWRVSGVVEKDCQT